MRQQFIKGKGRAMLGCMAGLLCFSSEVLSQTEVPAVQDATRYAGQAFASAKDRQSHPDALPAFAFSDYSGNTRAEFGRGLSETSTGKIQINGFQQNSPILFLENRGQVIDEAGNAAQDILS